MKLLALTIGGEGAPQYTVGLPVQIAALAGLSLNNIISFAILLLLTVSILLSLFFIIFGGIKWILSQGDKKQLEEAQKTIIYAIVGLILVFLSFFIINFIGFLFGVPLLKN